MKIFKIPDQVVRLCVIFIIALVILIAVRYFFVPKSFGKLGYYRADSLESIMAQPLQYAGASICTDCHPDIVEIKNRSFHRGLSCEACHGPAARHAENPDEVKPFIPTKREQCAICHDYLMSRPTGFPQINTTMHNPNRSCPTCHNPHDPTPPRIPGTCAACHNNIARMKALSYHASLECETCHEAHPKHNENPRMYIPRKPVDRMFCGKCHSSSSAGPKEIPRVDVETHGGRYLCWQCHYPHFPEVR